MGGVSSKYKVHPGAVDEDGSPRKKMLMTGDASSSVIDLLKSSVQFTKHEVSKEESRSHLTQEQKAAGRHIERSLITQRSEKWLEAIAAPKVVNRFKDPDEMYLTRPQRLRLENIVHIAFLERQQTSGVAARKPPYWSLMFTDEGLLTFGESLGISWDGPRARADNTVELAKHEGEAYRTEDYFLRRPQRRELELAVELGFKRQMPNVRMPQLSLRYTDKALLELANSIEGILLRNIPRAPPKKLRTQPAKANSGPTSAAGFGIFIRPIVEEYLKALPATGGAVTLVVRGEVMYCQGFGLTGRCDKIARNERRARQEFIRTAKRRARDAARAARAEAKEELRRQREEEWTAEEQRLQDEAMRAAGLKTEEELELERRVRAIFQEMDTDGSGTLTTAELRGGMASYGLDPEDGRSVRILAAADADGDGHVTLREFLEAFEGQGGVDEVGSLYPQPHPHTVYGC